MRYILLLLLFCPPKCLFSEVIFKDAVTTTDNITRTSWVYKTNKHLYCAHPYHYGAVIKKSEYPDVRKILDLIKIPVPFLTRIGNSENDRFNAIWFEYTASGGHVEDIEYRFVPLSSDPINDKNRNNLPKIIKGIKALDLTLWPNKGNTAINFAHDFQDLEYLALPFYITDSDFNIPESVKYLSIYNQNFDENLSKKIKSLPYLETLSIWGSNTEYGNIDEFKKYFNLQSIQELRMFNTCRKLQYFLVKANSTKIKKIETDNQNIAYTIARTHPNQKWQEKFLIKTPNLNQIVLHFYANEKKSLKTAFLENSSKIFKPKLNIIIYK